MIYDFADSDKRILDAFFSGFEEWQNGASNTECVEILTKLVKNSEAEAEAIASEIQRLSVRKQSRLNAIDKAKTAIKDLMNGAGIAKHKTDLFSVSIRNSPISTGIIDMSKLPSEFVKTKQEPDRQAILKHYKDTGEVVSGVEMLTDKQSIIIK